MTENKKARRRGNASRASEVICSTTNTPDFTPPAFALQAAYIARRVGTMDPATLAALAALAFGEAGR